MWAFLIASKINAQAQAHVSSFLSPVRIMALTKLETLSTLMV